MKAVVFFCSIFFSLMTFAQNGSIKGTVTDSGMNEEPILFANVQLKGAERAAETNFHGNFEFEHLKSGTYTLVISYLGYETIEVPVIVAENEITRINSSLSILSISMADFERIDEQKDVTEIPKN